MVLCTLLQPEVTPKEAAAQLHCDLSCILAIQQTCYLQERSPVAKAGTLHIAWEYANSHRIILRNISNIPQIHCALGVVVILGPSAET
jgi:hypothetical protein